MPNAPAEHPEEFRETDPRLAETVKMTPQQSVEMLQKSLASKNERMTGMDVPDDPKSKEQFAVLKRSVDARLELINSMA